MLQINRRCLTTITPNIQAKHQIDTLQQCAQCTEHTALAKAHTAEQQQQVQQLLQQLLPMAPVPTGSSAGSCICSLSTAASEACCAVMATSGDLDDGSVFSQAATCSSTRHTWTHGHMEHSTTRAACVHKCYLLLMKNYFLSLSSNAPTSHEHLSAMSTTANNTT
jgi:hypothetical protein